MKKKSRTTLKVFLILLIIFLLIAGYIKFFNGKIVNFTTGLKEDTLMKQDDNITYTFEAKILMSDAKKEYEAMFGSDIWSKSIGESTFEEYIKDQIRVKLLRVRCMNALAKERGVVLGKAENDGVRNAVDDYYNALSENEIKDLGVDKDKLNQMFTEFAIAKKLYEDITSVMDIEVSSDEARVIDIQYIVNADKEKVENAYNAVKSGSSFFAVAKECNEDGQYEYELKRGETDPAFEEVAYNLSTGEMSDIVEAGGKYYVIRCTSDNDKTKTEANKSAIIEKRKLQSFNETFEQYEADLYIEWNSKVWDNLKLSTSKTYSVKFEDIFNSYLGG